MLVLIDQFYFNSSTRRVDVYLETDTGVITSRAFLIGTPDIEEAPPGSVTEEERGYSDGELCYNGCVGFDYFIALASINNPFAVVSLIERNSTTCGFSVVCDIAITDVAAQSPSYIGLSDGTITVTATTSGSSITYSLDGINYQESNIFSGLLPGDYVVRARDNYGCEDTEAVTVPASTVTEPSSRIYPWEDKACHWFRLLVGSTTTNVQEPIKWDAVTITAERDMKWHGWNWQYSDGEIQLEFDCPAGKDILEEQFDLHGNDAEVEFLFGYTYKGVEYEQYRGKIDFNTYKRYPSKVAAVVVRKDYMDLLQSRMDEKFTLTAEETMGGEPIAGIPGSDITLHGKVFATRYILNQNETKEGDYGSLFDTASFLVIPDTTGPIVSEIQQAFEYAASVYAQKDQPYDFDLYAFKLQNDGTYDISITLNATTEFNYQPIGDILSTKDYTQELVFAIRRNGTVTETVLASVSGSVQGANVTRVHAWNNTYTVSLDLVTNDEIFYFIRHNLETDRRSRIKYYQTNLDWTIDAVESKPDSLCRVWWLDDVAGYGVQSTTDNGLRMKSRWIEKAGGNFTNDSPFSLYVVTNGYNIRRFIDPERPLQVSMKDVLGTVNAITAAGYGLEKFGRDWLLRIEPVEYFFQDVLILYIEETEKYEEEVAREKIYNAVDIGYQKYEEDGIQQLDEFNTRHEYLTPIKTYKGKLEARSPFIASGYSLEQSRRNQFAESSSDSVTNDEDAFIIAVRRDGSDVIPEKDEAFQTVDNVISPETSYNLRLSPKRMLLNWWRWLKSGLFYKQDTEAIKNTFADRNGELQTQFLNTEPNLLGDVGRDLLTEKDNVLLSDYGDPDGEPIYRPEWVDIVCRLNPAQVELINNAMTGHDRENRNYGYIMVLKPDGEWQAFWPYSLKYNYTSERCEMRGLKKWSTPEYPVEECCAWLVANGCYILANNNRLIA